MRKGNRGKKPLLIFTMFIPSLLLPFAMAQFEPGRECFCNAGETVEPCPCEGGGELSIDAFNQRFQPYLQSLLTRDFFRFYKVNMDKPCPFWPDDRECASRECGVEQCDDRVPPGLRLRVRPAKKNASLPTQAAPASSQTKHEESSEECRAKTPEGGNTIDPMDRTISEPERDQLARMDQYDEGDEHKFCEVDDEDSSEMHYVDLSKNPERYTGYKGDSALRVWKSIYQENCFKPDMKFDKNFLAHPNTFGLCLEKRVFYRLISGLHSAITISIAAYNYKPPVGGFGTGSWFRNVEMFAGRFGTKWSWEGPQRLRNVYLVWLLELRALVKAAPYLQAEMFYTGNEEEDARSRAAVAGLVEMASEWPAQFDESEMFRGVESTARELREEFRGHFLNISRIMDCVGCDKCRLWGKVQVHGMGTALKILFSDLPHRVSSPGVQTPQQPPFQLTRNEVVALFQSLGRYSTSILEVDEFRVAMGLPGLSGRAADSSSSHSGSSQDGGGKIKKIEF